MADIRIKDLTTTASSSASDDFIAVDGTTNGTRKLNAFSPTFGGNATVTGTLTVNGTGTYGAINLVEGTTLGKGLAFGTDITIYRNFANQLSTTAYALTGGVSGAGYFSIVASGSSVLTFNNGSGESFRVGASRGVNIGDTADVAAGSLKVSGTTASTTTSTGALVVSGGVGVGGAASLNGPVLVGSASDVYLSRVGAGILDIRSASSPGTTARLDVTGTTSAGVGFRQSGTRDWFISAESAELRVSCGTAGSIFAVVSGNPVAFRDTTASTSTSSGSLVCSGGVGVAGAVFVGGDITASSSSNITGGRFTSINSNSYIEQAGTDFNYVTASTRPHVFSIGGTTRFQVTTGGIIAQLPASASALSANSTMTFELTSNTSLKIAVRGTDGTTRSVSLTLA